MKEQDPFPEIIQYIEEMRKLTGIDLFEYDNSGPITESAMKEFLRQFIQTTQTQYVIAGTRSTDPYAQGLSFLTPTDEEKQWPKFVRVLPIYNWTYAEVWDFILKAELPYCDLYNHGFTYVGDRTNTTPNPFIKGKHAMFASDNTELFSRKKLVQILPKTQDKITFGESQLLVLVARDTPAHAIDFLKIDKAIRQFCHQNGFVFEGDAGRAEVVHTDAWQLESGVAFENTILQRKQQPNQFSILYMGVSVHPTTHSVRIQL